MSNELDILSGGGGAAAHPGFFSRNMDGRVDLKKVDVQMKRRSTMRKDRKLRSADWRMSTASKGRVS